MENEVSPKQESLAGDYVMSDDMLNSLLYRFEIKCEFLYNVLDTVFPRKIKMLEP